MIGATGAVRAHRGQGNVECLPPSCSTLLFETGSYNLTIRLASELWIYVFAEISSAGISGTSPAFYVGDGDPNVFILVQQALC